MCLLTGAKDEPASLALAKERRRGVDRSVSGVDGPVEEEGSLGFSLPLDEVKTLLQRQPEINTLFGCKIPPCK